VTQIEQIDQVLTVDGCLARVHKLKHAVEEARFEVQLDYLPLILIEFKHALEET